jgi:aryl-alcohol dehydrogenase-like predicted oxidoreductase
MIYKKLGSTGMMVSRVGFGGIPILSTSDIQAEKVIRRAFEKGVNFIDTHRGYGDSEIKIGNALSQVREQVYLATKISDHTRIGAQKSLRESLKRLKTKYIDLLFIKNLDSEEALNQAMGKNGSLRVARQAQKAGIVRHIGMTSHHEKIAYKALRTGEYEAVMYPYSIVNLSAEKRIFRYCSNNNIGFVCMKPVAGGLLTSPSKVFAKMAKGKANTTAAAAMRFCLSHPSVSTVIPGHDPNKISK